MKRRIFVLCFIFVSFAVFAQVSSSGKDLGIGKDDVLVIQDPNGGYHLYIKARPGIKSVILTESTRDPALKLANYSYRDPNYNPINGDEKRMLDGKFISKDKKIYSLIDSTPEENTPIGTAFHIWIPYIIVYGYDWTRHGEVEVQDGTFFNIRSFAAPYGDYAQGFKDNPFLLRVTQKPVIVKTTPPPKPKPAEPEAEKPKGPIVSQSGVYLEKKVEKAYSKGAVDSFRDLAEFGKGKLRYAKNPKDIVVEIKKILEKKDKDNLDLLFALDATESMKDDIDAIRKDIMQILKEVLPKYKSWRIALIIYKDYREDFLVREACVFTNNLKKFEKALTCFKVFGGRDIPEAVYEGLHLGLLQSWRSDDDNVDKKLILLGDAPPHSRPRGKVKKDDVYKLALEKRVGIYPIIMPHGLSY